jgi:hypothetical protein
MNQKSRHASERAAQRGITNAQLAAVIKYGDRWARRGRGVESIWISKDRFETLAPVTPEGVDVDRLKGIYVLVGTGETVVTVVRTKRRFYRRDVC